MEAVPALALVSLGGIGLYFLGGTAVSEHRRAQAGERKIDEATDTRVSEDLVAYAVAMTLLGVVFQSVPPLLDQVAVLRAGASPWTY